MVQQYSSEMASWGCRDRVVIDMYSRFPDDGSQNKAMRWLGFLQGCAYALGAFSLDELKEHSRKGSVP